MGITEEELAECIQLAASVGAGTIRAMARRASKKSEPEIDGLSIFNLTKASDDTKKRSCNRMNDKVIITAAITGSIHTPTMSPYDFPT